MNLELESVRPPAPAPQRTLSRSDCERFEPIVRRLAMRTARRVPRHILVSDLVSDGWLGLVEAFSVESAPGFALAVQWHPEWQAERNPASMALLGAFGDACRAFHDSKVIQPVKTVKGTATAISIRSTTLQQNTAHAMRDPET